MFIELKHAAESNLEIVLILKIHDCGSCGCFFAHQNYTVMERSKLFRTKDDLTNLKHFVHKPHVVVVCTRERLNTK